MKTTIEQLRTSTTAATPPSITQVRRIIHGLTAADSCDTIAEDTQLSATAIQDIVSAFGTWLSQSKGKVTPDDPVTIPTGFTTAETGRELHSSITSLTARTIEDSDIVRWVARKYETGTPTLTYPVVAAVRAFAQLGKLDEISEVSPSAAFHQLVVQAYDLLEEARTDAVAATTQLCTTNTGPATTIELAQRAALLHEAAATRLHRIAAAATEHPDALEMLHREQRHFANQVQHPSGPQLPSHIGELTDGQMLRIAQHAGLPTEKAAPAETRRIREQLASLGLEADADQLIGPALNAAQNGTEQAFWDAMRARANHNIDWHTLLEPAAS